MERLKSSKKIKITEDQINDLFNPMVISFSILKLLFEQKNCAELLSLYLLYYYISKYETKTHVTNRYIANRLHWGSGKLKKYLNILIKLNLIIKTITRDSDNSRFTGNYYNIITGEV